MKKIVMVCLNTFDIMAFPNSLPQHWRTAEMLHSEGLPNRPLNLLMPCNHCASARVLGTGKKTFIIYYQRLDSYC